MNDQPPVPGGTTAIRDGKYVREDRAPGPPSPVTPPGHAVYEVVVRTDEGYFTVVVTGTREEADALAARGDSLLWDGPDKYLHFEVKEHPVMAVDPPAWSRQDFIDAIDHPEPEDWFAREEDAE